MMKENESRIFEFQIAKKLISEQNYSGIRLRKLKTYVEDEVSAEATILAQSTSEYQPIKESIENAALSGNQINCRGAGKTLKLRAYGDKANLRLLEWLVEIEKLEPEAKHLLSSTLEFMGKNEKRIGFQISRMLGKECEVALEKMDLEKDLLILDCTAKVDSEISREEFFEALSRVEKSEEFGIIK